MARRDGGAGQTGAGQVGGVQKTGGGTSGPVAGRVSAEGAPVGNYVAGVCVEGTVRVEVKATVEHHDVYVAQVLNYLRATRLPIGLLLNFGRPKLMHRRLVLK